MFRQISESVRPHVERAEALLADPSQIASVTLHEMDESARLTRKDYGRFSRWLLGVVATLGVTLAIVFGTASALPALEIFERGGAPIDPLEVAVSAVFVLLVTLVPGVPSVWLLVSLHRSGRRLSRAAGFWAGLPYRTGRRLPVERDWFVVRFLVFTPDMFLRLFTAAASLLITIFWVTFAVRSFIGAEDERFFVMSALAAILFAAVTVGQFWGAQRIQNGHLARDPMPLF